jgi:hypothetical protein
MHAVLVVANQTITNEALLEAVKKRAAEQECTFTLLVPATPSADLSAVNLPHSPNGTDEADQYELARTRLSLGLRTFRQEGIHADGDVGDPDPIQAIRECLNNRQFDEIIVSTLPRNVSRWLHQDLPHKVERKFHLPVTVITAART